MEFPFMLKDLFPNEISIVQSDLIPIDCPGLNKLGSKTIRNRVAEVLDAMGQMSTDAHGLCTEVTNAHKIRNGPKEQKIFILCDFSTNQTMGLLKVGPKHLFLFDSRGKLHDMHPICILDFYIHESNQRMEKGRTLFDFMLSNLKLPVEQFAVDSPSEQMIFFLQRHYKLNQIMPQINHFVIYKGFFSNRQDYLGKIDLWARPVDSKFRGGQETFKAVDPRGKRTTYEDSLEYNYELRKHLESCKKQKLESERIEFANDVENVEKKDLSIFHPCPRQRQDSCNWFRNIHT